MIGLEVNDMVQATDIRCSSPGCAQLKNCSACLTTWLAFSEDMHRRNRQLKDFLFNNLYRHYRVVRMALRQSRLSPGFSKPSIRAYYPAQARPANHPERGLERTLCDHIAGMTDRYAIEEYKKLYDRKPAVNSPYSKHSNHRHREEQETFYFLCASVSLW